MHTTHTHTLHAHTHNTQNIYTYSLTHVLRSTHTQTDTHTLYAYIHTHKFLHSHALVNLYVQRVSVRAMCVRMGYFYA